MIPPEERTPPGTPPMQQGALPVLRRVQRCRGFASSRPGLVRPTSGRSVLRPPNSAGRVIPIRTSARKAREGRVHILSNSVGASVGSMTVNNASRDIIIGMDNAEFERRLQEFFGPESLPAILRFSRANALVLTDALDRIFVLPWDLVSTYDDLASQLLSLFKGRVGERYVSEGRFSIARAAGASGGGVIGPDDWKGFVGRRERVVMSMLIEQILKTEDLKKTCPNCGPTDLGTFGDQGWYVCRKCNLRFIIATGEEYEHKVKKGEANEEAYFRHVRKMEREQAKEKEPPVAQEPAEVAQEPAEVAQEPAEVAQEPAEVAQEPAEVAQEPAEVAQEPAEVAQEPAEVAQDNYTNVYYDVNTFHDNSVHRNVVNNVNNVHNVTVYNKITLYNDSPFDFDDDYTGVEPPKRRLSLTAPCWDAPQDDIQPWRAHQQDAVPVRPPGSFRFQEVHTENSPGMHAGSSTATDSAPKRRFKFPSFGKWKGKDLGRYRGSKTHDRASES